MAGGNNNIFTAHRDVRTVDKLTELHKTQEGQENIRLVRIGVADESSIDEAYTEVGRILGERQLPPDYLTKKKKRYAGVVRSALA